MDRKWARSNKLDKPNQFQISRAKIWRPIARRAFASEWSRSRCPFSRTWHRRTWTSCTRCWWTQLNNFKNKWNQRRPGALWEIKMPNKPMVSFSIITRSKMMARWQLPWIVLGLQHRYKVCAHQPCHWARRWSARTKKERYFKTKKTLRIIKSKL